jgi:hypothetical protein
LHRLKRLARAGLFFQDFDFFHLPLEDSTSS